MKHNKSTIFALSKDGRGEKVRLRLHHYICLKGHLSGSLEKACNLTYVNKGDDYDKKEKETEKGLGWRRKGESRMA